MYIHMYVHIYVESAIKFLLVFKKLNYEDKLYESLKCSDFLYVSSYSFLIWLLYNAYINDTALQLKYACTY